MQDLIPIDLTAQDMYQIKELLDVQMLCLLHNDEPDKAMEIAALKKRFTKNEYTTISLREERIK